mgnify:CR=1 FL=1
MEQNPPDGIVFKAPKDPPIEPYQSMVTIEHLKSRIRLAYSQCGTRLGKSHGFCPGCAMVVDMRVTEEKHHPV